MKIAMLRAPKDLRVEDQPLDTVNIGPRDLWVRTEITAFKIGTDRGNYEGAEQVAGAPAYPRWVGDSNLGTSKASVARCLDFELETESCRGHHTNQSGLDRRLDRS